MVLHVGFSKNRTHIWFVIFNKLKAVFQRYKEINQLLSWSFLLNHFLLTFFLEGQSGLFWSWVLMEWFFHVCVWWLRIAIVSGGDNSDRSEVVSKKAKTSYPKCFGLQYVKPHQKWLEIEMLTHFRDFEAPCGTREYIQWKLWLILGLVILTIRQKDKKLYRKCQAFL